VIHPRHLGPRRAFLRRKRKEGQALLKAIGRFRFGCVYLPPADNMSDMNGATLMNLLGEWLEGPCREEWKKA